MSILNALKTVKESGFNVGDAINTSTNLESGIYPVRIKQAERREFKGQERANITLEVVSGDHKDRLEFLELNFNDTLPEFVLEKNGKILLTLIDVLGVDPTKDQLETYKKQKEPTISIPQLRIFKPRTKSIRD